jgi:farnesyl-diphosphate farnesyltransferase
VTSPATSPGSPAAPALAALSIDELLARTSRTFALSIPRLPEPTRGEVATAYLLFRIADTFEDAVGWPRQRKLAALGDLTALLAGARHAEACADAWLQPPPPIPHAGYQQLLAATPQVLGAFHQLGAPARAAIRRHLDRTVDGMARFVERTDGAGALALRTLDELRDYCYVVAGIVGEMLTELFLLEAVALQPIAPQLRQRAARFGEGLQLVNILRDAGGDEREGRTYLPAELPAAAVLELAREDLRAAGEYVRALQAGGAAPGLVAFTALPVLLAGATLAAVEADGPGAKVSRQQVATMVDALDAALANGAPVL